MIGGVYLVQPTELIGTNRYKIGCSHKRSPEERINSGYHKGTKKILIFPSNNAKEVEKKIISSFDITFNKIAGNEYYEGDINLMVAEFTKIYNYYNDFNNNENIKSAIIIQKYFKKFLEKKYEELNKWICEDVKLNFNNYLQDYVLGGNKLLINFYSNSNSYNNKYEYNIEITYIDDIDYNYKNKKIDIYDYKDKQIDISTKDFLINDHCKYNLKYCNKLLKIFKNNEIYDLNDKNLIKIINSKKEKINVKGLDINKIKNYRNSDSLYKFEKIEQIFQYELIINDYIHCSVLEKDAFRINLENDQSGVGATILNLNNNWIDFDYLRINIPYVVCINSNKKEIYIQNRDYCYFGSSEKYNDKYDYDYQDRIWIFNDGNNPYNCGKDNYNNLKLLSKKYYDILKKYKDYTVINSNENIDIILNL